MATCMYHKTEAPEGIIFTDEELKGLGKDWVDTPAEFKKSVKKTEQDIKDDAIAKQKEKEQKIKDKAAGK